MGGVVGCHNINPPLAHGGANRFAVGAGFYRRIAFQPKSPRCVIRFVKEQVVNARFGGDFLFRMRAGRKQLQLPRGGNVQDVQPRAGLPRQVHGHARGFIAGLGVADLRVRLGGDVFAEFFAGGLQVGGDAAGVFAVGCDNARRGGENFAENFFVVHQHSAGGGAHEDFDSGDVAGVCAADILQVVDGRAQIKAVVHPRITRGDLFFFRQQFGGQCGGICVWHLHKGGDSPGGGGAGFGGDVGFVGESGLAEVDLVVHQPGQDEASADFHRPGAFGRQGGGDGVNPPVANADVGGENPPVVGNFAVF